MNDPRAPDFCSVVDICHSLLPEVHKMTRIGIALQHGPLYPARLCGLILRRLVLV
jgi:hypothetical protein